MRGAYTQKIHGIHGLFHGNHSTGMRLAISKPLGWRLLLGRWRWRQLLWCLPTYDEMQGMKARGKTYAVAAINETCLFDFVCNYTWPIAQPAMFFKNSSSSNSRCMPAWKGTSLIDFILLGDYCNGCSMQERTRQHQWMLLRPWFTFLFDYSILKTAIMNSSSPIRCGPPYHPVNQAPECWQWMSA